MKWKHRGKLKRYLQRHGAIILGFADTLRIVKLDSLKTRKDWEEVTKLWNKMRQEQAETEERK
jgi:hypothetical protein